jgi:hypothetical protein
VAVAHESGVQVDRVGHDGRAEHRGREKHRAAAVEARDQPVGEGDRIGRGDEEPGEEADGDHAEQADDHVLEGTLPEAGLHGEQAHRYGADDDPTHQQRESEQDAQGDRPAHDLGDIRRDRHGLRLQPEQQARAPAQGRPEMVGEGAPGDRAELRREVLDEHRHEVRDHEHPQQQVAMTRARGDVRGDVAGVHVRDGGDEGRAQQAQRAPGTARAAPSTGSARRATRVRTRGRAGRLLWGGRLGPRLEHRFSHRFNVP